MHFLFQLIIFIIISIIVIYIIIRVFKRRKSLLPKVNNIIDNGIDTIVYKTEKLTRPHTDSPTAKSSHTNKKNKLKLGKDFDDLIKIEKDITEIDIEESNLIEETEFNSGLLNSIISEIPNTLIISSYGKDGSKRKGESIMRRELEKRFGLNFPSVFPDFLKNPNTNRKLELDCYCYKLNLGLEFHGIQHYEYPNPFHRSQDEFDKQVWHDEYKIGRCKQEYIVLIVVDGRDTSNNYKQQLISLKRLLNGEIEGDNYVKVVSNMKMFKQLIREVPKFNGKIEELPDND